MEYQALARKYRPRNFASLMGQEHVSKALANALRSQRLHHAYLFSGTRGVGKTTIARILAKSLNCETGIVAEPCGKCATCKQIDEGRFIDLIEVDAASKTKVEDTREMLDNVQYAPVQGRFKIYLIDEVHMLSGHSFNALLKTLEEPPEHVKFLLATTDPQKLPITVLSRCLQFNLRHLTAQQISQQLCKVLTAEKITYQAEALEPIAQAADGSMRDALSLLDQAIAYADGNITLSDIDAMLGNVPSQRILAILSALVENNAQNAQQIMHALEEILALGMGVDNVLIELINVLQKMAMLKMLPDLHATQDSLQQSNAFEQQLLLLAEKISSEDLQLYYQIALAGRTDLELSPFPQAALEMILLRMLAFRPMTTSAVQYSEAAKKINQPHLERESSENLLNTSVLEKKKPLVKCVETPPNLSLQKVSAQKISATEVSTVKTQLATQKTELMAKKSPLNQSEKIITENTLDLDAFWNDCVYKVNCSGIEKEILQHCCLLEKSYNTNRLVIKLALDSAYQDLLNDTLKQRLKQKLVEFFSLDEEDKTGFDFSISILADQAQSQAAITSVTQSQKLTPKQIKKQALQAQLEQAEKSIAEDANVQLLINQFSGKIIANSIQAII